MNAKRIIAVLLLLSLSLLAQTSAPDPQTKPKPKKKAAAAPSATAELATQVRELRLMMDAQQQQLQQLQQAVQSRDQKITELQNAASQARSSADAAAASSSQNMQAVSALQSTIADIKLNDTNMAASMLEEQKRVGDLFESPLAIHYKGVTITPGGFLAAESVWRQKAMASDVNTPFNSIPFNGADASHLSEWFGSGRQSRITLLVEGKIKTAKLSGYYETDWLSAGVTSNNNQSNSYTNRMRQIWGQAALDNGWTFTGGQMWSLVTETRKGLDNRSEALPMTIDAQYAVGFSWTRQFGFRVTKNFNNKFWLGASVENAQPLLSGRNIPANFLVGNVGTGGGLYNVTALYGFNQTPDFVVKAAFEPGFGHYEVFGIARNFRDRIYGPAGTHPVNDTRTGGGFGANARWSVAQKHVDIGIHALGGDGVGRYGTSTLPDITVRPADSVYGTSTLAPIHSYQGLVTLEWHSPHWDIYTNGGIEYAQRTIYRTGNTLVGYGIGNGNMTACNTEPTPVAPSGAASPPTGIFPPVSTGFNPASGSCAADTRSLAEGTIGFWYKAYNGPKGRLQFGPQYAYVLRDVWGCAIHTGVCTATSALNPHAVDNIILTSFRYYLP
jgi:hypothetical protein